MYVRTCRACLRDFKYVTKNIQQKIAEALFAVSIQAWVVLSSHTNMDCERGLVSSAWSNKAASVLRWIRPVETRQPKTENSTSPWQLCGRLRDTLPWRRFFREMSSWHFQLAKLRVRILCALKRLVLLLMASLKRVSWGDYQRSTHTAYFTKSVYLLSPKLVCSGYVCRPCRPCMHLPPVCITVFLYLCARAASPCLMLYYSSFVWLGHPCLPLLTCFCYPPLDWHRTRSTAEMTHILWGEVPHTSWRCLALAAGLWTGIDARWRCQRAWMWPHLLTGKFQLSRTRVVPYKQCVWQPPSYTETYWDIKSRLQFRRINWYCQVYALNDEWEYNREVKATKRT